jgi:phospholipase C
MALLSLNHRAGTNRRARLTVSKPVAKVAKAAPVTAKPIEHLVVIFQENASFNHYFGTYSQATNPRANPRSPPRPTPRP